MGEIKILITGYFLMACVAIYSYYSIIQQDSKPAINTKILASALSVLALVLVFKVKRRSTRLGVNFWLVLIITIFCNFLLWISWIPGFLKSFI